MKFKKTLLEKFMIRKSKSQKTAFIDWVKEELKDSGYDVKVEKGSLGVRNIVIGDLEKAKVVYTAHYDTCAVMPVPNFITPTNFFVYLLYQFLLVTAILLISLGVGFGIALIFPDLVDFIDEIYFICMFGILMLMMFGPANKNTVNDNTSGTLTILEMILKVPVKERDKVAFVLFDLEEGGLLGSSSFASKHKKIMKEKLLINFDCVSDGEKMLFIFNKKAKGHEALLKDVYTSTDDVTSRMVTKGAFYPSDQANVPMGVGVCAVICGKKYEYIDKIHTNKDVVCRDENINYLVDKSIELIKKI